jgi:hypothetical protein
MSDIETPALGAASAGAGIDNAGRHVDTTPSRYAPIDLAEIRFARAIGRLHPLGPRVLAEFLAELGAARMIRTEIEAMVERYINRLDPKIVRALGGDRFPVSPIRAVGDDR